MAHGEFNIGQNQHKIEADLLKPPFKKLVANFSSKNLSPSTFKLMSEWMRAQPDEIGQVRPPDHKTLAAGYTYFGQLVAHDISSHRFIAGASPTLCLNTIYGMGPGLASDVYQHEFDKKDGHRFRQVKMRLEGYEKIGFKAANGGEKEYVYDLPRLKNDDDNSQRIHGIPVAVDSRNDQNFILSQLTVVFIRLHNLLCDYFYDPKVDTSITFAKAREALVLIYQAVIRYDYLRKILDEHTFAELSNLKSEKDFIFYSGKGTPELSSIFSSAVFRFGHSQVRDTYQIEKDKLPLQLFANDDNNLKGFIRDEKRSIDWRLFFESQDDIIKPQKAKAFDHQIASTLSKLPFLPREKNSLIDRNISKSIVEFPNGLSFFNRFITKQKNTKPISALLQNFNSSQGIIDEITSLIPKSGNKKRKFALDRVPLWLFILMEAEALQEGQTLGPLGSRIIAEQIMWVLMNDKNSVIHPGKESETNQLISEIFGGGLTMEEITMAHLLGLLPDSNIVPPAPQKSVKTLNSSIMVAYFGNELQIISNADLTTYKNRVNTQAKRTTVLGNGFYDTNPGNGTCHSNCMSGIVPPNKKILGFVSRTALCWHAGVTDLTPFSDIKGIIFHFAKEGSNLILVGSPVDTLGTVLGDDHYKSGTPSVKITSNESKTLICNYVCDSHQTLKTNMPALVSFDSSHLLSLIGSTAQPLANIINFHFIASLWSEFKQNPTTPSNPFFNLALESTVGGVQRLSDRGAPCPPDCY